MSTLMEKITQLRKEQVRAGAISVEVERNLQTAQEDFLRDKGWSVLASGGSTFWSKDNNGKLALNLQRFDAVDVQVYLDSVEKKSPAC